MKEGVFTIGDIKEHSFVVDEKDTAQFQGKELHPVCSTYKLGKEMEWSSRLFMLDIIDDHEEGVGTMLHIEHLSPAFVGERVDIRAIWKSFEQKVLLCDIEVSVGDRMVARGATGQKLLSKEQLKALMKQ